MLKDNTTLSINFIEGLYKSYLQNPENVDASWQEYFTNISKQDYQFVDPESLQKPKEQNHQVYSSHVFQENKQNQETQSYQRNIDVFDQKLNLSFIALQLIQAYRKFGHTQVNLDPLQQNLPDYFPELDYKNYSVTEQQLTEQVQTFDAFYMESAPLKDLILFLQKTYSDKIGVEFDHIESLQERTWFINKLEQNCGNIETSKESKITILENMMSAHVFEHYLHTKFPGAKRFSIEGGEASIAAVEQIVQKSVINYNAEEFVIGMAHRGRLSVLSRVLTKPYSVIFAEFLGASSLPNIIPGDVKYHMGASYNKEINGKNIHLSLAPNPSHLESVNSVVLGRCKAKQDIMNDTNKNKVVPLLIHGDASVAGQGCVMETLASSQLNGYSVGGAIHVIINNQIGFTTNPEDTRFTRYCSNIAKFIDAPIIHVNSNDPEAVIFAANLATEYRHHFHKDIFLDIVCYRKYGHNEGDEPLFTQPLLYKNIQARGQTSSTTLYKDKLIEQGVITEKDYKEMYEAFLQMLDFELAKASSYESPQSLQEVKARIVESSSGILWKKYFPDDTDHDQGHNSRIISNTGVPIQTLIELGNRLNVIPENFHINTKIARQLEQRTKNININEGLDWSAGESLAYGSLLLEGHNIRFTGEDVERGTFSHRHAVLTDQENEEKYIPLNNIHPSQKGRIYIHNSNLSEFGVLGFEYGYSAARPDCLTIWEGQFGDFANGAQIIIDQYISSGEAKWMHMSGLVLLLPHGYEGQGPEHSSARIERYLQLCANNNMRVCNCSTPASFFHAIRRQIHTLHRKPLVVFTPKSLLRHKLATSNLSEMAEESKFVEMIDDSTIVEANEVVKLILCSGKIYYDLFEKRQSMNEKDRSKVALVRMEQIYPFPKDNMIILLQKYSRADVIWCQEEHENMGAYSFVKLIIDSILNNEKHSCKSLQYVGRIPSSSPATGFLKVHVREQEELINKALSL